MSETSMDSNVKVVENAVSENKEKNDSMEELKFDEEDEKNVSAEDILGTQSLLMSDSENERSPLKKVILKNKPVDNQAEPAILQTQMSEAVNTDNIVKKYLIPDENKDTLQIEDDEEPKMKAKKKIHALVDTESEEEYSNRKAGVVSGKSKKVSTLVDSESEEEVKKSPKMVIKNKKQLTQSIDSDNSGHDVEKTIKIKKFSKKKAKIITSDSEQDSPSSEVGKVKSDTKFAGLVDSDSEQSANNLSDAEMGQDEAADKQEDQDQNTEDYNDKKTNKKNNNMRASAKKAIDEIQLIQSETQRLHREATISVPYHQPKRHTLQEFLSRRSINKTVKVVSPTATAAHSKSLKMSKEELENYAKLMEERAKEATEFFKSESDTEDEQKGEETAAVQEHTQTEVEADLSAKDFDWFSNEEIVLKDNPGILDHEFHLDNGTGADADVELTVANSAAIDLIESAAKLASEVEPTDIVMDEQPTTTNNLPIVTEVLELPRLDISTLNISPTKVTAPKPAENLKRLILEKSTNVSPAIKGDANMVIDLETGDMYAKKPTGVDTLLQRLIKTREVRKGNETETVNIPSASEKGKFEISKVHIATNKERNINKEQKPGAAYQQLKQSLQNMIKQKRLEDLKKKQQELQEYNKGLGDEEDDQMDTDVCEFKDTKMCAINVDEEEQIEEDNQQEDDEAEYECEKEIDNSAGEEIENGDADEDEADGHYDNDDDDDNAGINNEELEDAKDKRKNRIIRAFQDDSDDNDDDIDFLQTPIPASSAPVTETQMRLSASKLFDAEEYRTVSDEENELLDLCSGNFADSQVASRDRINVRNAIISQMPVTQNFTDKAKCDDELLELCSGSFDTQSLPTQKKALVTPERAPHTKKIFSSDEDKDVGQEVVEGKQRKKKLTKKMSKRKIKLGFSDDEDDDDEEQQRNSDVEAETAISEASEVSANEEDELPQTFVDYDSEENEIIVEMTKKDRVMRASNFVEEEADLSESEWGSADEDEKDLNKYDIELGDEDEFDREKLRSELEQIHARKMLDKDIREVRFIQGMLFEDEENDGVGRQRQFKWKNVESGFTLDDKRDDQGEGKGDESGEERDEHLWRKIRFEREQLLLEKSLTTDATSTSFVASPLTSSLLNTNASVVGHKLNIVSAKKTSVEVKKNSPFLIAKNITQVQQKSTRGSFLVRDKETLKKLAGLTKGGGLDTESGTGTVSVKSVKAKNFVFATLTEEEHENQKRKADELLNSNSETGINYMKKPRLEPNRGKCLIDQLL